MLLFEGVVVQAVRVACFPAHGCKWEGWAVPMGVHK